MGKTRNTGDISAENLVTADISNDRIGINSSTPAYTLDVNGDVNFSGTLYQAGVEFSGGGGGGGSGTYDTGITTAVYVNVTSGDGTTSAETNNVFVGPSTAFSFPSTSGKTYVIESIHISNKFVDELYFSASHNFNGGSNIPIANRIIIPYQGATEFLDQPIVANPSDHLNFQALDGTDTAATGINNGLDAFITYSEKTDTDYVGVGSTVPSSSSGSELFYATTYPAVIQSIKLCNYSSSVDVDASVSVWRGGTKGSVLTTGVRNGYYVYNLTVPKNSVIEILEKPKYLVASDCLILEASGDDALSATLSGKYIT